MTAAERNVLYYGSPEMLPERVALRAGPLSMVFEAGDLRYVKLGGREVVRRIYAAVRDRNWGTVQAGLSNVSIERGEDSFVILYEARHRREEIDFAWRGRIVGEALGRITFTFDGEARSTFLRNRIGFCVLHPDSCAGVRCRVTKVDGTVEEGAFPRFIAPHQPFLGMKGIAHEVTAGTWVEVDFEGDEFEMEDQRNWIDGSFKTYGTPLRLGFPVEIAEGTNVRQAVTVAVTGEAPAVEVADERGPVRVTIGTATTPIPQLGLQLIPGHELTEQQIGRLGRSYDRFIHRYAHVRADVRLHERTWDKSWKNNVAQARSLGLGMEVAVFCAEDAARQLASFIELKPTDVKIVRFLLHDSRTKVTPAELARLARETLGVAFPSAPIFGGTDAYFTELNRSRPRVELLDGVCYSVNPQVHAFDNASMTECAAAIAATVESARQFAGDLPIAVTPVTLKPRFNPDATAPPPPPKAGELPAEVDVRQMSLFGACWTLASLKYLAESGVHSVTYYETVGWRGVMEGDAGSPLPEVFRSVPRQLFPLEEVLSSVNQFSPGRCIRTFSSDPLRVESLLVRREWSRLILANMTGEEQDVCVADAPPEAFVQWLDETTAPRACGTRPPFRRTVQVASRVASENGEMRLTLRPFALAAIDAVAADDASVRQWPES